jgi:hypothetical protein|tara:strand:- start:498 stop:1058 length:561 start_codon:yes stop_codon:yes gene_type:complete
MACNCTKCSSKCGCADTALTNACTYTDCSVGSERCDDIQCASCVSYCGTSFQIGVTGQLLSITSGERLDSIIQKFASMISNGLGACTSSDLVHNPYNSYAGVVTSSTINVLWDGIWSSSTGLNVYYDTQISPSGWVLANATPIVTTISNYTITNLTASTAYKIKIQDSQIGAGCEPIELLVSTIAV